MGAKNQARVKRLYLMRCGWSASTAAPAGWPCGAGPATTRPAAAMQRALSADDERTLRTIMAGEQDFIDNKVFYTKDAKKKK